MSTGFTVPNSDINFPYSISVGNYQRTPTQAGTIFYNPTNDRFEGYVATTRAYNNSRFLPLSLDAATTSNLGGIKVGNNLSITADGTLNAVAESSTQKFQKILSVSPYDNVADYTSINQCLTQFFGYDESSDTFPDGELASLDPTDYPIPSATTRYIIHLMPGTYTESDSTINLPPFISLVGEDRDSVFINVNSTTQINCYSNRGGGQQIANLTINLNNTQTSSATGIETANCSNILLNNINFTLTNPSGYDITAIAMSNGSNNTLAHIETDISSISASNNEVITLLTASATTSLKLKNCDLSLSAQRGLKRFINASSDTDITVQDTSMTITETNNTSSSHRNECILLTNSDLNVKRSNITTSGYDLLLNDDTHNNRTIVINNTSAKATTTQTEITFTHYEDATQYDEILCEISSLDFSTLFSTGDYISVSGANEEQNNQIFEVVKIYSEDISGTDYSIIQVSKQDQLVDETFNNPTGITIKSLYTVNINNSQLTATNNTIKSLDTATHGFIRIANSDLSGDAVDVGNNKVIFNTRQVIRVGKQNADYASIYDAIQSINDNNAVQCYMIYLLPGEYYEQRQLVVPEYVSIIGENSKNTKLIFDTNSGAYPDNVAIKLASNTSLENITITQNDVIDSTSDLILVGSNNLDVVEASATAITNVEIYNCHIEMNSNPATNINLFKFMKTTVTLTKTKLTTTIKSAEATTQEFRAFNNILSNLKVYDLVCDINGISVQTANTTVFNNDRTVMTCENPQVNLTTSGSTDVVNIIAKCEDTAESDITLTDISPYTNIIQGGMIRVYNGTTNYALYADYNATLFTRNLTYEGAKFLRNNADNDHPNSFLKTLTSYRISADGSGNIYNISATDNYGSSVDESENVMEGEDVGTFIMSGTKNILFGIRLGGKLTTGGRNVMMGVDLGNHDYSISDNVLIGIDAGNVITDNKHVIIGSNTATQLQTGTRDIIIGYNAASSANNTTDVTVMGVNSALELDGASNLVVIGNDTAPVLGDGSRSVLIGTQTATSLVDGEKNVILGSNALTAITDIDNSVVIGHEAGNNTTSANETVIIGSNAVSDMTTMTNSVIIGHQAGKGTTATAGDNMVVIGHEAGLNIGSATKSVIIGSNVGQKMSSDATMNMIMGGFGTANELTSGSNNIVSGSYSASALTTGNRNIIMGNHSGQSLDTTDDTIILGHNSGSNISGGNDADDKSIIIGNSAGQFLENGGVIFIGHEAGKKATGEDSIIIGNEAGRTVSGARNTLIGNKTAGISNNPVVNPVDGHDNILIGNRAGFSLTTGNYNVVVGSGDGSNGSAGNDLTTGEGNMIMGYRAGRNLVDGDYNFLFGREAGFNINDGSRNFIMGDRAGYRLNSGGTTNDNMVIGNSAAYNLTEGEGILMIGQEAGYNATTGDDNLFIGKRAGYNAGSGSQSVYIGNEAGYNNTLNQNTMIGVEAGRNSTTSERNTFIGYAAGRGKGEAVSDNNTGDQNIAIGYEAGSNLVSGYQSLLIGNNAGRNNEAGAKNIMIGPNSGRDSTASKNIFIGSTDSNTGGVGIQTTGEYNIFLGVSVGENNTSGSENTMIGSHAGAQNTTGSNSIFIGNDAGKENTTGDGNIRIGKEAGRDGSTGSNNVIIGPEAGKTGESSSAIIIGKQAGMNNQADSQIFIGHEAGKNNTSGSGSVMIGSRAGLLNEEGNNCIFIGPNSGSSFRRTADSLGENIYIGSNTGTNNETGIRNIVIGTETFESSNNGSGVIAIGYRAGRNAGLTANQADDYNNIMIGQNAVSGGDIGLNNTMIGSNVGRNVDNANKFVGNAMIGADAGKNANLAINSVVLGNSGRVGTGGEDNILAGFATGDNLGLTNTLSITTLSDITTGSGSVIVDLPFKQINNYLESGDTILIKDPTNNTFEVEIGALSNSSGNSSINFTSFYTGTETLETGSTLFTLAKLSDNVGVLDNSKSSANTLMGNSAGNQLTEGSKCVALGSSAMYKNETGKYNNILGTQAGYSLRSDNNTCYGTRAGYSIDEYSYTNNTIASDLIFNSNTNTISSVAKDFSGYDFGDVIDIKGTTRNDNQYIVKTSNAATITVSGVPEINKSGVPINVSDFDLQLEGTTFNFMNQEISGVGLEIGYVFNGSFAHNLRLASGVSDSSNIAKMEDIIKTNIIEISGSKFNDGVHYIDIENSTEYNQYSLDLFESDGYYPACFTLRAFDEVFDSNVTIKLKSIADSSFEDSSEDINHFSKFLNGAKPFVYYGNNKQTLTLSPDNNKIYNFNDTKSVLVETDIVAQNEENNVIFTKGYIQNDIIYTNVLNENKKFNGTITFVSSNNTIIIDNGKSGFSNPDSSSDYTYYYINGTVNNNGYILLDDINSSNGVLTVDSSTPLTDEVVNGDTNPVSFSTNIIKLNNDIRDYGVAENYILNIGLNSDVQGGSSTFYNQKQYGSFMTNYANVHSYGTSCVTVYNSLAFADSTDMVLNPYGDDVTLYNNLIINRDLYKVDNDYCNNNSEHINGSDFMYQTGNITPVSGTFTMFSSNSVIYSDTKYQFVDLVAPVMVKVNSEYYLVRKNAHPFQHLELDNTFKAISSDDTTTSIDYHSISIYQGSCNLALMTTGADYRIFNNNDNYNHNKIISPVSSNAIANDSVYLSSSSNITTNNTNNRVMVLKGNGAGDPTYSNSYFKNIEFSATNVVASINSGSNIILNFHSDEISDYYTASGTSNIAVGDIVKISNSGNTNIDGIFGINAVGDLSSSDPDQRYVTVDMTASLTDFTLNNISLDFRINEFRSGVTYDNLRDKFGDLVDFIRFGEATNMGGYLEEELGSPYILSNTLNFTVESWDNSNVDTSTYNSMYLKEDVPRSYTYRNDANYYAMLGTPILSTDTSSNKKPIGYIDMIKEACYFRSNATGYIDNTNFEPEGHYLINSNTNIHYNQFSQEYIGPRGQPDFLKGNLNIHTANNYLTITNLSIDNANIFSDTPYLVENDYNIYLSDKLNKPFKNVKPGMPLDVFNNLASNTYIVKNKINDFTVEVEDYTVSGDLISNVSIDFNANDTFIISTNITSNLGDTYDANFLTRDGTFKQGYLFSDRYKFNNCNTAISSYDMYLVYLDNYFETIDNYKSQPRFNRNKISVITTSNVKAEHILKFEEIEPINDIQDIYYDNRAHTLVIPTSNLSLIESNPLSFTNQTTAGLTCNFTKNTGTTSSTIEITAGGTTTGFSVGNIINISGSDNNDGYYLIQSLTSSLITIDNDYNNLSSTNSGDTGITIATNSINSSSVANADLSKYKPAEKIIITLTENNNTVYNIKEAIPTATTSLYLVETVTTEEPDFCLIERSNVLDETSQFTYTANLTVDGSDSSNSEVRLTGSNSNTLVEFIPGQTITISGATEGDNNNTFTISDTIPTSTVMKVPIAENENTSSITISKNATLTTIGESIDSVGDFGVNKFHYLDAQGNNLMLGSFAGHYSGVDGLSTQNIYIGNKVGQTNQGSGNLFFGNETLFAESKNDGATTYSNKLAIYKNNFAGIPTKPMIGGDFGSGRVGINTIDPDSFASTGTLDTATKLVVNGAVRASAHNTFTGTHIIRLSDSVLQSRLKSGMCMVSTGNTQKVSSGILDTIVSCNISTQKNDKRIYGIYSHYEKVNGIKQHYVASVGEGMILVCNIAGEPENGDYVATSPVRGLAQLQSDDLLHNYTVAKITEDIDWSNNYSVVNHNNTEYKVKLVSCTYHCG